MQPNLKYQEKLCVSCQEYLLTYRPPVHIEGQTFESFKNVVDEKCIICSVVWHENPPGSWADLTSPETWCPLLYFVSDFGLKDPRNELRVCNVKFRFVPAECMFAFQVEIHLSLTYTHSHRDPYRLPGLRHGNKQTKYFNYSFAMA